MVRSEPDASGWVWGLISDVHGNLPALNVALDVLQSAGASRFAFLGDYLGRGDSDGCVRLIRRTADVAIVGNRDLDWQDRVSVESKAWVIGLPRTASVGGLLLAHGDVRLTPALSTAQIGQGFPRAWRDMDHCNAQIWAFGHSHHARTWRKASAAAPAEQVPDQEFPLESAYRYFLNVGTTGLPFAGKGGPSVALVDFAHGRVRHILLSPPTAA